MRLQEIQHALRDEGLDGWLFFDHHLRDPLAYRVLQFQVPRTPTRRWYYFVPSDGEPSALVHRVEPHMLDTLPGKKMLYAGWQSQIQGLKDLLQGCQKVAMQYSPECAIPYVAMVDGGTLELVRQTGVEVITSANLVQLFEARWTDEQFQTHLEAGCRVDRIRAAAFDHIGQHLRSGRPITEWHVNRFVRSEFDKAGMITDHGPIVAVNANMSDPHYEPSEQRSQPIRKGDAVLLDMWAKLNQPGAVYYDITWSGFCGTDPPETLRKLFTIVRDAREKAVECVKSAVAKKETLHGYEVDDAARNHIVQHGYGEQFVHRTGHSIGEEVHGTGANMDNLETHDVRRIIPGTCFSIEPGVYLPEFGIRSEVNVFVGPSEARTTGEAQSELVKIV